MAADPRLVQYVKEQIIAGFRKAQIYDALTQAGWYKEEIDEVFYEAVNQIYGRPQPMALKVTPAQPTVQQEKPGFFWKLKNVLFHPSIFFGAIKNESGIKKALGFYGILNFINFIIMLAVLLFAPTVMASFLKNPILQSFIFISLVNMLDPIILFLNYFIILALTLLTAGILHFFVYTLRGSKGFYQTYKALMYATAPMIFLGLLFLFYMLSFEYPFMVFPALGLIAILGTWILILAIKGLSSLHDMSILKALVAIFIPFLIIFIVLFFAAATLFALGVFNPATYTNHTAMGFSELGVSDWNYKHDGTFYMVIENQAVTPITINSVTAVCGNQESSIVLQTLDPTHLERGANVTYSTDGQKCALKEPGESYSVSVIVRYLEDGDSLKTVSGAVTGAVVY